MLQLTTLRLTRKQSLAFVTGFTFLFFTILTSTYVIASIRSKPILGISNSNFDPADVNPTSLPIPPATEGQLNLLLAGYGGPGHPGGNLSDVILIVHLNPETKVLGLVSIPRDLYVNTPQLTGKINAAYAQDPQAAKTIISQITGIPIEYYLGIDFVGFQRAIAQIGGIEVEVEETLDDPWYPITGEELNPCGHTPEKIAELTNTLSGFELEKQFPCRYEHLHFDPGTIAMEGGDALKYVRSRHTTSDFSRSRRAQAVVQAIIQKLLSAKTLDDIPAFFKEINTHLATDLDPDILKDIAPFLIAIPQLQIKSVTLTTDNVLTTGQNTSLLPQAGPTNYSEIQTYIHQSLTP